MDISSHTRVGWVAIPNIVVCGGKLDTTCPQLWLQGSQHSLVVQGTINSEVASLYITSESDQRDKEANSPLVRWMHGLDKCLRKTFTHMHPREVGKPWQIRLQFEVSTSIASNPVCSKCKVRCPIIVRPEVCSKRDLPQRILEKQTVRKSGDYAQECASHTCISLCKMSKCTFQALMIVSLTLVQCGISFSFMPS